MYFKEVANFKLTDNNEVMNRECILFFKNSYLIVASSESLTDENFASYEEIASNNESRQLGLIENYTIYLVNINRAKLCDKIRLKSNKLNLTHNQSLCLFKNVFTVLSQQNQTIYLYNIVPLNNLNTNIDSDIEYKFVLIQEIGRFCNPDDKIFIKNCNSEYTQKKLLRKNENEKIAFPVNKRNSISYRSLHHARHNQQIKPFNEVCFTSMKQRILTFFFKEALEKNLLSEFYNNFSSIINLKMYKMQLLDDRFALIKYVNGDNLAHLGVYNGNLTTLNTPSLIPTESKLYARVNL